MSGAVSRETVDQHGRRVVIIETERGPDVVDRLERSGERPGEPVNGAARWSENPRPKMKPTTKPWHPHNRLGE